MISDIVNFSRRPDLFAKRNGEWFIKRGRENEALDWIEAEQRRVRTDEKDMREHKRLLAQGRRAARNVTK